MKIKRITKTKLQIDLTEKQFDLIRTAMDSFVNREGCGIGIREQIESVDRSITKAMREFIKTELGE